MGLGLCQSSVYFGNWTFTREINTPYVQPDGHSQYYATSDFYPRKPYWWETGAGAWHGLSWMATWARPSELANGDPLYAPPHATTTHARTTYAPNDQTSLS